MARPLVLLALSVLAVGASSPARDAERADDGRHRVAYAIDRITGEYLFADDIDSLMLGTSLALPPETSAPSGNSIQMSRIDEVTWDYTVLSSSEGFDMDHDGNREFIIGVFHDGTFPGSRSEFYEATEDNSFALVHVLEFTDENTNIVWYVPGDVGDADGDGLAEVTAFGRTSGYFDVRLYESDSPSTYPTEMVWEDGGDFSDGSFFAPVGAEIADTDGDGWDEFVAGGAFLDEEDRVVVYENECFPGCQLPHNPDGVGDACDNCIEHSNTNQQDSDSDAVGNVCDNCVYGPNPSQGAAIFGQDVVAVSGQTFSWPASAEVVYVKGRLAQVDSYLFLVTGSLGLGVDLTDTSPPPSGVGFYYLVRPDCDVGSWQTSLGAEPERDLELP